MVGILISTIGVIYLILKGEFKYIENMELNNGALWIILASFIWALYSVIVKFKPKELNDFEFFATTVFLGFLALIPLYLFQGYEFQSQVTLVKNNLFIFLYLSIFASCLSYYFWNYGVDKIGASKTGQFAHLMPIFGSFLAYIFLDEMLQFFHIVGAVLIFFGIYLSLFYKKKG